MEHRSTEYVPESLVAACAATAMMLVYSAPTPGTGSRYLDGRVAHESKALSVLSVRDALAWAGRRGVGETVLESTRSATRCASPRHATPWPESTPGTSRSPASSPGRRYSPPFPGRTPYVAPWSRPTSRSSLRCPASKG